MKIKLLQDERREIRRFLLYRFNDQGLDASLFAEDAYKNVSKFAFLILNSDIFIMCLAAWAFLT